VMKKMNDKGYALLTVLLVSTLLILISFTFFGQSMNTVKQNKVVETKSQAVALAEMGTVYYQHAVENAFWQVRKEITIKINNDINNNRVEPDGYFDNAVTLFKTYTNNITKSKPVEDDASFTVENVSFTADNDTGKISIAYSTLGKEKENTAKLSAEFDFSIKELKESNADGSGGSIIKLLFDEVKKLGKVCYFGQDEISTSCNTIALDGSKPLDVGKGSNHNNFNNKIIYSTGPLTFGGNNVNNLDYTKIHAEDQITANQNMQNAKNSTIETKKSISVGSHLDLEGSRVIVGENLTVNGKLNLLSTLYRGSFVVIKGNATIDNKLEIDSKSTLCVGDILKIDNEVKTYKTGLPDGVYTNDHPQFASKCGGSPSAGEIDWGIMNPNLSVDYDY